MHGILLLISTTCLCSLVLVVVSAFLHLPWFRWRLRQRDPLEFERTRAWLLPIPADWLAAFLYFLRREYLRSQDPAIRAHGAVLRWTFSFPLLLASFTLILVLGAEQLQNH